MFLKGVDGRLRGPGQARTPIRVTACVVAITAALAASGSAQMFGPAPPAAQQGAPPCMAEFVPLRQEAEKRAAKIKAAAEQACHGVTGS